MVPTHIIRFTLFSGYRSISEWKCFPSSSIVSLFLFLGFSHTTGCLSFPFSSFPLFFMVCVSNWDSPWSLNSPLGSKRERERERQRKREKGHDQIFHRGMVSHAFAFHYTAMHCGSASAHLVICSPHLSYSMELILTHMHAHFWQERSHQTSRLRHTREVQFRCAVRELSSPNTRWLHPGCSVPASLTTGLLFKWPSTKITMWMHCCKDYSTMPELRNQL